MENIEKADPYKRVAAVLIDFLIISMISLLLGIIADSLLSACFGWALGLCFLFKDSIGGQSIGKRLVGIVVVTDKGKPADLWSLVFRNLFIVGGALMISLIYESLLLLGVFIILALEYLFMIRKDGDGQRIGDYYSRTKVQDLKLQINVNVF